MSFVHLIETRIYFFNVSCFKTNEGLWLHLYFLTVRKIAVAVS